MTKNNAIQQQRRIGASGSTRSLSTSDNSYLCVLGPIGPSVERARSTLIDGSDVIPLPTNSNSDVIDLTGWLSAYEMMEDVDEVFSR